MKKIIAVMMLALTLILTGCGEGEPETRIYNGRFEISDQNEYVRKIKDLKTDEVRWETKDGEATEWLAPDTTWEEARELW